MRRPEPFWGFTVADILRIPFADIEEQLLFASKLTIEELVIAVTKRRKDSESDAEILACNRIISACVKGPDVIEM